MLIASAKIPEREGKISPFSFFWASARLIVTYVSLINLTDEFLFWFLV